MSSSTSSDTTWSNSTSSGSISAGSSSSDSTSSGSTFSDSTSPGSTSSGSTSSNSTSSGSISSRPPMTDARRAELRERAHQRMFAREVRAAEQANRTNATPALTTRRAARINAGNRNTRNPLTDAERAELRLLAVQRMFEREFQAAAYANPLLAAPGLVYDLEPAYDNEPTYVPEPACTSESPYTPEPTYTPRLNVLGNESYFSDTSESDEVEVEPEDPFDPTFSAAPFSLSAEMNEWAMANRTHTVSRMICNSFQRHEIGYWTEDDDEDDEPAPPPRRVAHQSPRRANVAATRNVIDSDDEVDPEDDTPSGLPLRIWWRVRETDHVIAWSAEQERSQGRCC